jgi:hypothetical protein
VQVEKKETKRKRVVRQTLHSGQITSAYKKERKETKKKMKTKERKEENTC